MSDRIYLGTRKGLFVVDRGAHGWAIQATAFLGDNVSMVLQDPRDGSLYAALDHGHFGVKLHRSADGGKSFAEVAVPVYPEPPAGEVEVNPFSQQPLPWRLAKIWSLETGGKDEPGVIWCGTLPGGLFRSRDRGASWEIAASLWNHPGRKRWFGGGADLPGIHSIVVDPRDSRRVGAGVSCGGYWLTADGGETWACAATGMRAAFMPPDQAFDPGIQDPHKVVQCQSAPDVLWAQHHNGIFRSTDAARSWQEIETARPSSFGFAVAVHPRDSETAWFVPAIKDEKRIPVDGRLVVSRTRDGGKSFEVLTAGLPQEHAYDLTYRHALDVDGEGLCLAFATTTGSLFVSEDGGESWLAVSRHLPPVYTVRFQR